MSDVTRGVDLYRFYSAGGLLLYVGISLHAAQRASQHKREKSWWPKVARMDVEHLSMTRVEAERHEVEVIKSERPLHNVQHANNAQSNDGWVPVDFPVQVGHVYAFGRPGCRLAPVGLVSGAWTDEETGASALLRVDLYSWFTGLFGYEWVAFEWSRRGRLLEATSHIDRAGDRVFAMDPLAEFQNEWRALWESEACSS